MEEGLEEIVGAVERGIVEEAVGRGDVQESECSGVVAVVLSILFI